MTQTDYLIVGGGVAGTTAAETIRQRDADASITIVSDEPYRFYSRIMLSKPPFFLGKIPLEQVFMKTEQWYADKRIAFLPGKTVTKLDAETKNVLLNDGGVIAYGKLLLAIGTRVRMWNNVPGAEKPGIHYLRTLDDGKSIGEAVKTAKRAVVIGGGFVGFEMCDILRLAGLSTTLVIRESYFWEPLLDETSGRIIEVALEKSGVTIVRKSQVAEVLGKNRVEGVLLDTGATIPCELVTVGIGTSFANEWVKDAGVACNRGILANEYLETNVPDIWTAGDVAEYHDVVLDEQLQLGNWVNAQVQGRVAAMNMTGGREAFKLVSFYTALGVGITIAFVGDVRLNEGRTAIQRGPMGNGNARILLKDNRIVGATMVNRTLDLAPLSKLIEQRVPMQSHIAELKNPAFDLKTLVTP